MNGLDLFSGIGGISLGLRDYVRPVAYCEIDPYCQGVLLSRMAQHAIKQAPIWDDIRTISGSELVGHVEIIYGGFPCQDISIAGNKKGLDGERSSLFFDIVRLVHKIEPQFVFLENVSNICKIGGSEIIKEFEKVGMECRWCCISARSVGAPHKRDRWFMLAYNNRKPSGQTYKSSEFVEKVRTSWLRYTGRVRRKVSLFDWKEGIYPIPGMDDGLPFELDRARALGNAVVPQQVKEAFEILMGLK